MLAKKIANLKGSAIKDIEVRASKLSGVVSLAQGIPSFDTPEPIKRRVMEAISSGWVAKYSLPRGIPILREAIAEQLRTQNIFVDYEEELLVTAGATEAIMATLLTILNEGDEVIIFSPSYVSYAEYIKVAGGVPVFAPLDENNGWSFDLKEIENRLSSRTKAILLCNPNNPTGTILDKNSMLSLASLTRNRGIYIILDEVYRDFIYDEGVKFFSLGEIPEYKNNLIRIFSFSKLYAMTGWRIGYLHAAPILIKEILKVHDTLVTCAPVVSQYAALAALEMPVTELTVHLMSYHDRRQLMAKRLDSLGHIFDYHLPVACYFFFPRVLKPIKSSYNLAIDILEKARVATVPGIGFGPNGENHLRFNFGRGEDDINEAFDRLEKYFKKYA